MRSVKLFASAGLTLLLVQTSAIAQPAPQPPQPVPDNVQGDQTPNSGLQPPPPGGASMYEQKMTAHHAGFHHYDSAAVEAHDALLITEVKSALANANLKQPYAITVDADHGTVILTGEAPDRNVAGRIYQIAAQCDGVKSVESHLDWPSKAN